MNVPAQDVAVLSSQYRQVMRRLGAAVERDCPGIQRKADQIDATVRTDLWTVAVAAETSATDNPGNSYPASFSLPAGGRRVLSPGNAVQLDAGVTATYVRNSDGQGYCIRGNAPGGTRPFVYDSAAGGLQPDTVTSCPTR